MGFLLPTTVTRTLYKEIIHVGSFDCKRPPRNHPEHPSNKARTTKTNTAQMFLENIKKNQYKTVILRDLGVCAYICGCQGFSFM